jgi:hypothetical protein
MSIEDRAKATAKNIEGKAQKIKQKVKLNKLKVKSVTV